jgi:hypothetical protein
VGKDPGGLDLLRREAPPLQETPELSERKRGVPTPGVVAVGDRCRSGVQRSGGTSAAHKG